MNNELSELAEGLTEAQREALSHGNWNVRPVCLELIHIGIVERTPAPRWPYYASLTPLGLAVRDYLRKQEGRG